LQIDWTFPAGRIALIYGAIALLSAPSLATDLAIKAVLITATAAAFVLMMRSDRRAAAPLLPSDAFSLLSATGAGLLMILLMSVGYSPLAIYSPLFLQRLHGVSPLRAGYIGRLGVVGVGHNGRQAGEELAMTSAMCEEPPVRRRSAGRRRRAVGVG
jgi:small-conductance mechanosensitive channel